MDESIENEVNTQESLNTACVDGNQSAVDVKVDIPFMGNTPEGLLTKNVFELSNEVSLEGRQLTASMMYPEETMTGTLSGSFLEMVSKFDKLSSEVAELRSKLQICEMASKPRTESGTIVFPRGRRQVGAFISDNDLMETVQHWLSDIASGRDSPPINDETHTIATMLDGVHEAYKKCTSTVMDEKDVLSRRTLLYLVNRVFNVLLRSESRVYTTMQQLHATGYGDKIDINCKCGMGTGVSITVSYNNNALKQTWEARDSQAVDVGYLRKWEPVDNEE